MLLSSAAAGLLVAQRVPPALASATLCGHRRLIKPCAAPFLWSPRGLRSRGCSNFRMRENLLKF